LTIRRARCPNQKSEFSTRGKGTSLKLLCRLASILDVSVHDLVR